MPLFFFLKASVKEDQQLLLKLGKEKTKTILVIHFV